MAHNIRCRCCHYCRHQYCRWCAPGTAAQLLSILLLLCGCSGNFCSTATVAGEAPVVIAAAGAQPATAAAGATAIAAAAAAAIAAGAATAIAAADAQLAGGARCCCCC